MEICGTSKYGNFVSTITVVKKGKLEDIQKHADFLIKNYYNSKNQSEKIINVKLKPYFNEYFHLKYIPSKIAIKNGDIKRAKLSRQEEKTIQH